MGAVGWRGPVDGYRARNPLRHGVRAGRSGGSTAWGPMPASPNLGPQSWLGQPRQMLGLAWPPILAPNLGLGAVAQGQGPHTKNTKNTFAKFHELSPSTTPQLVDLCVERDRKLVIKVIEHERAIVEQRKTVYPCNNLYARQNVFRRMMIDVSLVGRCTV